MISTSATVFAQQPEVTLTRLTRRLLGRYESIRVADGRIVLRIPAVGTVLLVELESALRLQYVSPDQATDFAARTAVEGLLRREFRRVVYTIAWDEPKSVAMPLR